jgi:molybdopterin biosynthesis enzyme MoaB
MKLAKLKSNNKNVIVLIPSKVYKGVYEDKKGNSIVEYKTLNLVVDENNSYKCVGDDDLEIIEEIND